MRYALALETGLRASLRQVLDLLTTRYFDFPTKQKLDSSLTYAIRVAQEIKPSETLENKKYNLAVASSMINQYVIMPYEIFSFWHVIGDPKRRFKTGRAILRGKVSEEVGGGLCQVSGLLYHASLLGGLEIIERHNHSLDLYTDETRYTPLGTDATVVYGYKDLRIKNNNPFPVSFQFSQGQDSIEVQLLSSQPIPQRTLRFDIIKTDAITSVRVLDEENKVLGQSLYKHLTP